MMGRCISWTQIGKSGFSDREIGVSNRETFSRQKMFNFVSKIVICSTVDHCKMFYLQRINEMYQFHSSIFWRVLYTPKCADTFYNPYLKIYFKSILNI